MEITLEPETERWITEEAQRAGTSPERYLAERLRKEDAASRNRFAVSSDESELIAKINEGFPDEFWARYRKLIAEREALTLSGAARMELIQLSDQVEAKNAERIPYLHALARRRGLSLAEVMGQSGLQPVSVDS